jgi:glycosyltransferase involved in cell wall biosynthesis
MDSYDTLDDEAAIKYSIVVPFYNEETIVQRLYDRIARVMRHVGKPYEMIFVNDGSQDGTAKVLERIALSDGRVSLVDLRRNFGQTTALQAGFDLSRGAVIIAMDGDLQHDPYEIPLFIRKIDEGYDIASGWRVRRGDGLMMRQLPSRIANWLLARASGVNLHDFGTTYKAYRREVLAGVRLYGDMHRFVPAVCARLGAKIIEVPIKNVRRKAGKSNYGITRTFRVAMDLLTLRFLTRYMTRPLHCFGKWGLLCGTAGAGILGYGFVRKIVQWNSFHVFQQHGPLMAMGFMLVLGGMLLLATGLSGEMLMRIYFEASNARTYAVRRIVRQGRGDSGQVTGDSRQQQQGQKVRV